MSSADAAKMRERLEYVRKHRAGNPSLRDFYQRLRDEAGLGHSPTYAAARKYHGGAELREAPAAYLAAVSKAYGINLNWLATGEGEPGETIVALIGPESREVRLHLNFARTLEKELGLREGELEPFSRMISALAESYANRTGAERADSSSAIARAVAAPLKELGVDLRAASRYRRNAYFTLIVQALSAMIAEADDLAGQPLPWLRDTPRRSVTTNPGDVFIPAREKVHPSRLPYDPGDALRQLQARHEKELADARELGLDQAHLAILQQVHALELQALAIRAASKKELATPTATRDRTKE